MFRRKGKFNTKRKIVKNLDDSLKKELIAKVHYGGNPEHKKNPGDFNLTPPTDPRSDKSFCDDVQIFEVKKALRLLKKGIEKGLISQQSRGCFPQNIWSVDENNNPLEAQLENETQGIYHGYPIPKEDAFGKVVLKAWSEND